MFPLSNGNNGDSCMKNGVASSNQNISCENSYATYTTHSGLTSGIPTRTTPTLTPTTLKNIEESFMNLNSMPQPPVEHHRQAGFVPPVVNISMLSQNSDSNGSYASYPMSVKEEDNSQWLPACMQASLSPNSNNSSESNTSSNKGRSGGRRRSGRSERLSPEEEERRRVRRERNKLAAARCRKRRMDHTNSLLDETEGLEDKRQQLQEEIARLRAQKDDLEFLLEAHKANCKINQHHHHNNNNNNHNSHHHNRVVQVTSTTTQPKLEQSVIVSTSSVSKGAATRPTSLSINPNFSNNPGSSGYKRSSVQYSEVSGIPINTPSNGIFNFESLMDGGTGFTPITNCSTGLTPINTGLTPLISCAGQQRSSSSDLSSPDTMNNPKLVSL